MWGRGADYSCPLGSLEAAQRDPGGGRQKLLPTGRFFREKNLRFFLEKTKLGGFKYLFKGFFVGQNDVLPLTCCTCCC